MDVKRVALIIPHTDIVLETDLQRELPSNYVIHTHRIWLDEVGEEAEKRMVDLELPKAVSYLKGITDFDCVVFGCTSASAVYGAKGLEELERYISSELNCRGISAFGAILNQIRNKGAKKITLMTPYLNSVNAFMEKSLNEFDINISNSTGLGLSNDKEISKVKPTDILNEIVNIKDQIISSSDLLLVSCTNFRAMEIYKIVKDLLGIDIITSNQSIFDWIVLEK